MTGKPDQKTRPQTRPAGWALVLYDDETEFVMIEIPLTQEQAETLIYEGALAVRGDPGIGDHEILATPVLEPR